MKPWRHDHHHRARDGGGADVEPEHYTILECDPPRRCAGDTSLVAAHEGRDAATVVWDDYYPALQDDYLALLP